MKKHFFTVAIVLAACSSLMFTSCIGSFRLTNKVLSWNNQISNKFVNELVFLAFWILPVYEVTGIADLLVINTIEFWSGRNPMQASTKVIDTDSGRYLVKCDGKGYDVICQATGQSVRLDFDVDEQTWSVNVDGENIPFMTFIDNTHVKMVCPDGSFRTFSADNAGVMAYTALSSASNMASRD